MPFAVLFITSYFSSCSINLPITESCGINVKTLSTIRLYSGLSTTFLSNPGPSQFIILIILSWTSLLLYIAEYTATLPPLECPPTYIFLLGYFAAICFKYSLPRNWDGTFSIKLMLKSSFHPTIELFVPSKEINIISFGICIVTAENCSWFSRSFFSTKSVTSIFLKRLLPPKKLIISLSPW